MAARASAARAQQAREQQAEPAPKPLTPEEVAAQRIKTLRGDIRDALLARIKNVEKPWGKLKEHEQRAIIESCEGVARGLVAQSINIVASRGFTYYDVTLGKISIDKAIEGKFSMVPDGEALVELLRRRNQMIMLLIRDPHDFEGERAPVEPENVGDLAMPKKPAETKGEGDGQTQEQQTGEAPQGGKEFGLPESQQGYDPVQRAADDAEQRSAIAKEPA